MCVHRCENFPGHVVGNGVHCVFMLVSEKVLPLEIEQGVTGAGGAHFPFIFMPSLLVYHGHALLYVKD